MTFSIDVRLLLKYRQLLLLKCRTLPIGPVAVQIREKTTKQSLVATSAKSQLDTNVKPFGEKVKETTKTVSYLGVILLGIAVTGTLFYAIFQELFSSKSPNNIYTKACKKCIADTRIQDKLGLPIIVFGEESRRGRRQHVSHLVYERDKKKYIRMRFYLKGSFHKGTVHLQMVENDTGNYEYEYLFVTVNDLQQTTIVVEDNRNKVNTPTIASDFSFE